MLKVRCRGGMILKREHSRQPKECFKAYWFGANEMRALALNIPKAPFTLERLRTRRKESSLHWQIRDSTLQKGDTYTCLFTQVHLALEFSAWELDLFTTFTMLQWHLHGLHVEWLWQALDQNHELLPWTYVAHECQEFWVLVLWAPSQLSFKHSLACHDCIFV